MPLIRAVELLAGWGTTASHGQRPHHVRGHLHAECGNEFQRGGLAWRGGFQQRAGVRKCQSEDAGTELGFLLDETPATASGRQHQGSRQGADLIGFAFVALARGICSACRSLI